ncbi:hypothetical protein KQ51_01583 [Candidatus Izimaplasma bacterium HR1]|uniref:hypothetical protein n=1 Tax=Candidatus Izimoplasma sp. HR1 TaxID=1541959 RepID=UPI0004F8EDEB|nr:hypothetical protein KQ51_01583 [Candidatus Izimaplasma bacterium HR1]
MKKLVLYGFLFLGGVIFTSAWFIKDGSWIIYPGMILTAVGFWGFFTIDYKE